MADEPVPVLVGDSEVNRYARRLETERDEWKANAERWREAIPELEIERDRLRAALADVKVDLAGAMERLEWWEMVIQDEPVEGGPDGTEDYPEVATQ